MILVGFSALNTEPYEVRIKRFSNLSLGVIEKLRYAPRKSYLWGVIDRTILKSI